MPRFKHLAEAGSGGEVNFVGNLHYGESSGYPVYIPSEGTVDFASATNSYRNISTKYINYSSLSSWEFYVEFSGLTSNAPFCVFGTNVYNQYFYNPTLEITTTSDSIWAGVTTINGQWETNISINLNEHLETSKTYGVKYGWDGEQLYVVVTNVTDNRIVANYNTQKSTNPHTVSSSVSELCFCNCAAQSQSRFPFYGKIFLNKCYVKENGVVTWGNADA